MSGFFRFSYCRPKRCSGPLAIALAALLAASASTAKAQPAGGAEIAGQRVPLPIVPQHAPRRPQGDVKNEQWQVARDGTEKPVASMFSAFQGSDAAVEVVIGQGRLLTLKQPVATDKGTAFIAVADPTVVDFEILPNPQMIRLTGRRAGVTDFSVTTAGGETFSLQVHVVYDLNLLSAHLRQAFPDALVKLTQMQEHIILEGQARSAAQVSQINFAVEAFLASMQVPRSAGAAGPAPAYPAPARLGPNGQPVPPPPAAHEANGPVGPNRAFVTVGVEGVAPLVEGAFARARVINLLRVPGGHQVMLQVKIAELNRTGLRQIGADLGFADDSGNVGGTNIAGAVVDALGLLGSGVSGSGSIANGGSTTAFGIFPSADFAIFLRALRRNSLLTVLAEPNLVAMSGHEASFLAGGQFPVPVPQTSGGATNSITVEFKNFGVQLNFLPFVLDDDVIRLTVTPEVSTIDDALGTTLVTGGDPVPGLNTRRATTTVELRRGQTLAIAGLLQVEIDGRTARIPGLGDLPYLGPLFSNTSHERIEKELLVLVTPQIVSATSCDELPPPPGSEIMDPNDWEFYFLNRIEGRTEIPFRSTTSWDHLQKRLYNVERRNVYGPVGFSECR